MQRKTVFHSHGPCEFLSEVQVLLVSLLLSPFDPTLRPTELVKRSFGRCCCVFRGTAGLCFCEHMQEYAHIVCWKTF